MARNLTVHEVAERMDRPVREIVSRLRGLGVDVSRGADELEPEEIQAMLVGKPPARPLAHVPNDLEERIDREPSVFDTRPSYFGSALVGITPADRELLQALRSALPHLNGQAASRLTGAVSPAGDEVFLVHGHDVLRHTVEQYIRDLSLSPVVLDSRPNQGRTIIEKLEAHANTSFAVVLLTPDDQGRKSGKGRLKFRARQNVVLELGYFIGRLGRNRVCAIYVPGVEVPSDFHGVLHVVLDGEGRWRKDLHRELAAAGLPVRRGKQSTE
jgi:predicted nucleotide-binding protein